MGISREKQLEQELAQAKQELAQEREDSAQICEYAMDLQDASTKQAGTVQAMDATSAGLAEALGSVVNGIVKILTRD